LDGVKPRRRGFTLPRPPPQQRRINKTPKTWRRWSPGARAAAAKFVLVRRGGVKRQQRANTTSGNQLRAHPLTSNGRYVDTRHPWPKLELARRLRPREGERERERGRNTVRTHGSKQTFPAHAPPRTCFLCRPAVPLPGPVLP